MYAQRYGTIPVVHATGGLKDSVIQYNPFDTSEDGVGTGWKFDCADAAGLQVIRYLYMKIIGLFCRISSLL